MHFVAELGGVYTLLGKKLKSYFVWQINITLSIKNIDIVFIMTWQTGLIETHISVLIWFWVSLAWTFSRIFKSLFSSTHTEWPHIVRRFWTSHPNVYRWYFVNTVPCDLLPIDPWTWLALNWKLSALFIKKKWQSKAQCRLTWWKNMREGEHRSKKYVYIDISVTVLCCNASQKRVHKNYEGTVS